MTKQVRQHQQNLDNKLLPAFGVLLAVGLVLGVVAAARWLSPVAALVMGLVFVGAGVAFAIKPERIGNDVTKRIHGDIGTSLVGLLGNGVVVLVGGLLLASAVMPYRWRTAHAEEDLGLGWEPPPADYRASSLSSGSDYDTSDYGSSGGLSGGSAFGGGASSGGVFGATSPSSSQDSEYGGSPTTPGYNSPSYGGESFNPSPSRGYGPGTGGSPSANPWNDR
ncbi:MAG: phage holin family protein [Mycobacteriales bacterium]